MVDISSGYKKINITVSTSGNKASVNATPDTAMYYSNKSREWAISDKIVDGEDYSSKYYANISKQNADKATVNLENLTTNYNEYKTDLENTKDISVEEIETAKTNAISDITNQETLSVDNVNTAGATQVNLAKEQATIATTQAGIATAKTSEVIESGNNALTAITEQETTSKNNIIAKGTEQIGLIQNEGATQIANVQSTGFYMRDDKLYFINSQGEEVEFKLDDIELNNPYSLFDSKYSDHELNNLSWLKSEGQWNAKAVYTDAYDKLLKVYNGTETVEGLSVKLSTASNITDYDFVLNTVDETFRLPLLDGSEDLPTSNWINIDTSHRTFTAEHNMIIYLCSSMVSDNHVRVKIDGYERWYFQTSNAYFHKTGSEIFVKKGQKVSIIGTTDICRYCKTQGNGSLYYYVGETVQNANLIDAGRIGEQIVDKVSRTGDTMTGSLNFNLTNNIKPIVINMDGTIGSLGENLQDIDFRVGGKRVSMIRTVHDNSSNNNSLQLYLYDNAGNSKDAFIMTYNASADRVTYNKPQIIKTYVNGTSGYRIWSDGYCEQWGYAAYSATVTVNFLKNFKDTNYNTSVSQYRNATQTYSCTTYNRTASSFQIICSTSYTGYYWRACGYLASGQY